MVPFYHSRIFERVNIALLDLFDRVRVNRYNRDGSIRKRIKVPLTFHFSKNFADFVLNTQDTPESKHTWPILGLRMGGIERNANATTARTFIREIYDETNHQIIQDMRPCPWTQTYTLTAYTEFIQDHFQMMEQIIPYFNPTFNTTIKEFEFSNLKRDIIVELVSVNAQYNDEVDREKTRSYVCDYTFKVKFDMYAPFYLGNLIKQINTRISADGRPIELIENIEIENMTIDDYNRKLNEVVSVGKRLDTIVASTITPKSDTEFVKYVPLNSDPQIELMTIPAGRKVVSVSIAVIEAYNDPGAVISVGTLDNKGSLMATRDSNLSLPTKYEVEFDPTIVAVDTPIYAFYDRKESTHGELEIVVRWA